MASVCYQEQSVVLNEGETVLDGLLRAGFDIPHGCKSGVCQSCMLAAEEGELPSASQRALKSTQQAKGYFLSCACVPQSDLSIRDENLLAKIPARVTRIEKLNADVLLLALKAEGFEFQAGQYLTLWRDNDNARCYSIAAASDSDEIHLHIKVVEDGAVSAWLANTIQTGDQLDISGPHGDCVYQPERPDANILLFGIGTGLAPLYGVLLDALAKQHQGKIHLVCAASQPEGFYYHEPLLALAAQHTNLKVDFICQHSKHTPKTGISEKIIQADVYQWVKQHYPSTKEYLVYLCGGVNFVQKLRKICFLAGANSRDIFADAFVPFNNTQSATPKNTHAAA